MQKLKFNNCTSSCDESFNWENFDGAGPIGERGLTTVLQLLGVCIQNGISGIFGYFPEKVLERFV